MNKSVENRKTNLRKRAESVFERSGINETAFKNLSNERLSKEIEILSIQNEFLFQEFLALEEELNKSKEKYIEFYEMSPVGYITIKTDSTVTEINKALLEMLKINKRDIILKNLCQFIVKSSHDKFCEFIREKKDEKSINYIETDLIDSEGNTISVRIKAKHAVEDSNSVIMAVHDISDHVSSELRLKNFLKELSYTNEIINKKNFELQEMNYKLEKVKRELSTTIQYKDDFLKSVYKDLTMVFSRFLVLSEEILNNEFYRQDETISGLSSDLYDSVKATIKQIDKYYNL